MIMEKRKIVLNVNLIRVLSGLSKNFEWSGASEFRRDIEVLERELSVLLLQRVEEICNRHVEKGVDVHIDMDDVGVRERLRLDDINNG